MVVDRLPLRPLSSGVTAGPGLDAGFGPGLKAGLGVTFRPDPTLHSGVAELLPPLGIALSPDILCSCNLELPPSGNEHSIRITSSSVSAASSVISPG